MDPHPAVADQPRAFWALAHPDDAALAREPAVHPYRPDWFAATTDVARPGTAACATAYSHPACAYELLRKNYAGNAALLEPALVHSPKYACQLLCWSAAGRFPRSAAARLYRETLLQCGEWGARYAKAAKDRPLLIEIGEWAAENRQNSAAAAAWHLAHHPREAVDSYRELLRSAPAQVYWAIPRLHGRGFSFCAADASDPKWAYHLGLSKFSRQKGDYLPALRQDPVWLVGYLLARDGRIDPKLGRETAARLRSEHADHPLLERALDVLTKSRRPRIPPALAAGQQAESAALERLDRPKNREVYRPTDAQLASEDFKLIVGPPRYTDRGYAKGTVIDIADGELAEIKSGDSSLKATYQIRLQAFRAREENRTLTVYTSRPISPGVAALGASIEPLPG